MGCPSSTSAPLRKHGCGNTRAGRGSLHPSPGDRRAARGSPAPQPNAPLRLRRSVEMSSCTRWRTTTLAQPTKLRATIVEQSTLSGRPWHPLRAHGAMSASASPSCPPCTPVPGSPCVMPSWGHSPRAVPARKKGAGFPRRSLTLVASWLPHGGSADSSSAKATCSGHFPCSKKPWASVKSSTCHPISPGWLWDWVQHTPC